MIFFIITFILIIILTLFFLYKNKRENYFVSYAIRHGRPDPDVYRLSGGMAATSIGLSTYYNPYYNRDYRSYPYYPRRTGRYSYYW